MTRMIRMRSTRRMVVPAAIAAALVGAAILIRGAIGVDSPARSATAAVGRPEANGPTSGGEAPAAAARQSAAAGPVYCWLFERSRLSGTTFSPTGGTLAATVVGPVRFGPGPRGGVVLDGNSAKRHRVRVSDDIAGLHLPSRALTVEAWVLLNKTAKWGGIVGAFQDNGPYERGWLLGNSGGAFIFAVASAGTKRLTYLKSPLPIQLGYWYHVVGTYDGAKQRLYVDGRCVAVSSAQSGPVLYPSKGSLTIGAYQDDNELYTLSGRIEQVAIFDRALSPREVRLRFDARKKFFPAAAGRTGRRPWGPGRSARTAGRTGDAGSPAARRRCAGGRFP
ncbi:MAG: LamG domain-containing protein, partial [Planctomycetes bacterium]|nr:LamG domain-containing protein [Planctomycetota bacterium]